MNATNCTQMSEEARALKNAYLREWRAKNPDKTRVINARYWEKRAARLKKEREEQAKREK